MKTLLTTVLLGLALCAGLTLPSRLNALTSANFEIEPNDGLFTPVRRGGFGGFRGGGFRGGGFRGGGFAMSRRVYRGGGMSRRYAVSRRAVGSRGVARRTAVVGRRGAVTRRTAVTNRGRVASRRTVATRTAGRGANRGAVRSATVVRRGNWSRPARYWWRPGAAIAAGAAVGWVAAATAAAWAGEAPGPGMCWYYTDASRTNGFWDVCP
jgi:hypothetical protein